jgi:hypothetical protein
VNGLNEIRVKDGREDIWRLGKEIEEKIYEEVKLNNDH